MRNQQEIYNYLTIDYLEKIIRVDFDTGEIFWKVRTIETSDSLKSCKTFNKRFANKRADLHGSKRGKIIHICRMINGKSIKRGYSAHTLIWWLYYKELPREHINHKNKNNFDNSIKNLELAEFPCNSRDRPLNKNNKSGEIGVYFDASTGKWRAQIGYDRKKITIGRFNSVAEAAAARKLHAAKFGFSTTHGRVKEDD